MLRDHPLMTRKSGLRTWPPIWTTTHHDKNDEPIGEVGILEDLVTSDHIDNRVFMFMQHQGFRYMDFMSFDDLQFCAEICILLKSQHRSVDQRDRRLGPVARPVKTVVSSGQLPDYL